MVFGDAEHEEVPGTLPVGFAEFPEGAADGVQPAGRHIDRAEAAVGREVGRAELLRPPTGQRLALVTAGEEGELARVGGPAAAQPGGGNIQCFFPFDRFELAAAARPDALQGLAQARRRGVVHDPGRALGAENTFVDRVIAVAFDVADGAVLQMHLDAAAARAHVAGGALDLVVDLGRGVDLRVFHRSGVPGRVVRRPLRHFRNLRRRGYACGDGVRGGRLSHLSATKDHPGATSR